MTQDHRFLGSGVEAPQFAALGSPGSGTYTGLETFENPGCGVVSYSSDEVMSKCPITGQPDFYTVTIQLRDTELLIESKSLKLWFQNLMELSFGDANFGIFCEALAVHIRDTVAGTVKAEQEQIAVQLVQKSRGGISITAVA